MQTSIRKRSRPRWEIAPIHLEELLGAAGMSGFLGVLDPPAVGPHTVPRREGQDLLAWFSTQSELLFGQLERQEEALAAISQIAERMNGAAARANHQAQLTRERWPCAKAWERGIAGPQSKEGKRKEQRPMKNTRAASVARLHRGASAEGKWEEWIGTTNGAGQAPVSALEAPPMNGHSESLHEEISRLAHSYWEERGRKGGSAEEDWFRAEAEIRSRLTIVV